MNDESEAVQTIEERMSALESRGGFQSGLGEFIGDVGEFGRMVLAVVIGSILAQLVSGWWF